MINHDYVKEIQNLKNNHQEDAIRYLDNSIFSACPGSGKTKTLVLKVVYLLSEIIKSPQTLACITYSKNASREFEKRFKEYHLKINVRPFFGTVHSFCLTEILFPFGKIFLKDLINKKTKVAKETEIEDIKIKSFQKYNISIHKLDNHNMFREIRRIYHDKNKDLGEKGGVMLKVIQEYEKRLLKKNLIDFSDIIYYSRRLIEDYDLIRKLIYGKYPWFIIDEYQDMGSPLHKIILSLLDTGCIKVFAVGDPHQSIYSFNGAKPIYFNDLGKRDDFKVFNSTYNYRCCQPIIDASIRILNSEKVEEFQSKNTEPDKGYIYIKKCPKGIDEQISFIIDTIIPNLIKKGNKYGDIGIFAMYNNNINYINQKFEQKGVPSIIMKDYNYEITPLTNWIDNLAIWCAGGWKINKPLIEELFRFWFHYWNFIVKDNLRPNYLLELKQFYTNLMILKKEDYKLSDWLPLIIKLFSLNELFQNPIFKNELEFHLDSFKQFETLISKPYFGSQKLSEFKGAEVKKDKVVLMTLHSSKGLQFNNVIMFNLEETVIPSWKKENLLEGRRLFYVGITRARHEIYLLFSGFTKNPSNGRVFYNGKSRFITELIEGKNCSEIK